MELKSIAQTIFSFFIILAFFLSLFLIGYTIAENNDVQDDYGLSALQKLTDHLPAYQIEDLLVDGSVTPVSFTPNISDFQLLKSIVFVLEFDSNDYDSEGFGADPALTNGVSVCYENGALNCDNLIMNHDFKHFYPNGYLREVDDNVPKHHIITSEWDFISLTGIGLEINANQTLSIIINDDLTALSTVTDFNVTFKGCNDCYTHKSTVYVAEGTINIGNTVTVVDPTTVYATTVIASTLGPQFVYQDDPYYWSQKGHYTLTRLFVGQDYNLLIGSNLLASEQQWINFTATSSNMIIEFTINSYSNETELISQLYGNNILYDQIAIQIIYPSQQTNFGQLIEDLIMLGIVIILGGMGVSIAYILYRRYA